MKVTVACVIIALILIPATSCSPPWSQAGEPELRFEIAAEVNADQELHIRLGVHNAGSAAFEGDSSFNGQMEVRRTPSGELRASAHVIPLEPLAPGQTVWPLDWHGQLDAGSYEVTWGAEEYGMTTESFTIVEKDGQLYFEGQALATPQTTPEPGED